MADRYGQREPRWNNSGYWTERDDDDRREGDYERARDYDREEMRRYGRRAMERGERMRALRGQDEDRSRDYRHAGGEWRQDRTYGVGSNYQKGREYGRGEDFSRRGDLGRDRAGNFAYEDRGFTEGLGYGEGRSFGRVDRTYDRDQGYNRGPYNSEMARGRGFERYNDQDVDRGWNRRGRDWDQEADWGRYRYGGGTQSHRDLFDPDFRGQDYGQDYLGGRDFYPDRDERGERGSDYMGNYWGQRERWRLYGQGPQQRGYTAARDYSYQIEGDWDDTELDREFDLDPGYTYEFGTDFRELNRANLDRDNRQAGWDVPGEYYGVGPRGYQRSQERIAEDIYERLTRHGQLDARGIHIEIEDGEVTLSGSVRQKADKYRAEDAIESIPGVQAVHNRIHVLGNSGVRVRGMGREDVVMTGRIQEGMRVSGMDGKYVGEVKQVRDNGFMLERPDADDAFIPFRAVKRTNGQIILYVAGNEVDRQGWRA